MDRVLSHVLGCHVDVGDHYAHGVRLREGALLVPVVVQLQVRPSFLLDARTTTTRSINGWMLISLSVDRSTQVPVLYVRRAHTVRVHEAVPVVYAGTRVVHHARLLLSCREHPVRHRLRLHVPARAGALPQPLLPHLAHLDRHDLPPGQCRLLDRCVVVASQVQARHIAQVRRASSLSLSHSLIHTLLHTSFVGSISSPCEPSKPSCTFTLALPRSMPIGFALSHCVIGCPSDMPTRTSVGCCDANRPPT